MIGIYKITSPSKKVYIGQSVDIEKRFKAYSYCTCKNQKNLYRSLKKYGFDKHKFEILTECLESELNDKERYYQDLYQAVGLYGMNCRLTKSNDKSGRISEYHKLKIGLANKGNKHSEETRLKMSKSKSNMTLETKLKMSISQTGKKLSDTHKQNIINATKGIKKKTNKSIDRSTKIILDTENGIFYTIAELCKIQNKKPMYFYQRLLGIHNNKTNYIYV
jgi:group I intron endonuclease